MLYLYNFVIITAYIKPTQQSTLATMNVLDNISRPSNSMSYQNSNVTNYFQPSQPYIPPMQQPVASSQYAVQLPFPTRANDDFVPPMPPLQPPVIVNPYAKKMVTYEIFTEDPSLDTNQDTKMPANDTTSPANYTSYHENNDNGFAKI